jgi:hypothetical protein
MLKATLNVKENIEIGAFLKVIAFLKRNAVGYEAKKSINERGSEHIFEGG